MNSSNKSQNKSGKERMVESINDHWIVLIKPIFSLLISWTIALVLWQLALLFKETHPLTGATLLLLALTQLTLVHHIFFIFLISWELDTIIITTKRVVIFRFLPYIRHITISLDLEEIDEIGKIQKGLIPNILNYGLIEINIPANPTPTKIHYVPQPNNFTELIYKVKKTNTPGTKDIDAYRDTYHGELKNSEEL